MLARGLNTNTVFPLIEPPPHSTPASLTLVLLVTVNTSDPLSPAPTVAVTIVWQSWVTLLPLTVLWLEAVTGRGLGKLIFGLRITTAGGGQASVDRMISGRR